MAANIKNEKFRKMGMGPSGWYAGIPHTAAPGLLFLLIAGGK